MESTSTQLYIEISKWLLGGGFAASLIGYLWNKYFRIRPKIVANLVWGGSTQSGEGPDRLRFEWRPVVVLHNDSIYKARRIKLVGHTNVSNWHFNSKLPDIIEPDSKIEWKFTITKTELKSTLIELCGEEALRNHNMAEAYLPLVIGKAKLIFSYDSDKDRTFYTVLNIDEKISSSDFHWSKPKHTENEK